MCVCVFVDRVVTAYLQLFRTLRFEPSRPRLSSLRNAEYRWMHLLPPTALPSALWTLTLSLGAAAGLIRAGFFFFFLSPLVMNTGKEKPCAILDRDAVRYHVRWIQNIMYLCLHLAAFKVTEAQRVGKVYGLFIKGILGLHLTYRSTSLKIEREVITQFSPGSYSCFQFSKV